MVVPSRRNGARLSRLRSAPTRSWSALAAGRWLATCSNASSWLLWIGDGSGFIFVGAIDVARGDTTESVPSLLVYEVETGNIASLVIPEPDSAVRSATISADGLRVVYCLQHGSALDLHAIDLNREPVVDVPLTDDGVSCEPKF